MEKEVIIQTIKTMLESGIDNETIKATLADAGLSEEEIQSSIAEAKGVPSKKAAAAGETTSEEAFEEEITPISEEEQVRGKTQEEITEKVKEHISGAMDEQAINTSMTHSAIEESQAKISDVQKDVSDLHRKIDTLSASAGQNVRLDTSAFDSRLTSLEKDLGQVKGATNALQDLLKKILETNRKILLDLETGKKSVSQKKK